MARVGLDRLEYLMERLKREINWGTAQHAPQGVALNTGCRKVQSFNGTLAGMGDGSTAFQDNDVMVQLGTLDVTVPTGMQTPTKIIVDKVLINITTAAGTTLTGHLSLSATTGTAANAAVSTPTEIYGLSASMVGADGLGNTTGYAEADVDFNSASLQWASPNIICASSLVYLYACCTTALGADAQGGRFNVVVEYTVL